MSRPFRRARSGPVLSSAEGARQGRAVRAAVAALADTEAVRIFLNSHHAGLSGRPLDVAVASDAGLAVVETAIGAAAAHALGLGLDLEGGRLLAAGESA